MNAMQRQETVEGLVKLREIWASTGWNVTLATCAEDIDLTVYGIEHNRCIDGDLMERVLGRIMNWFIIFEQANYPNRIFWYVSRFTRQTQRAKRQRPTESLWLHDKQRYRYV